MRVALRQETSEPAQVVDGLEGLDAAEETSRPKRQGFDRIGPHVVVDASPPYGGDGVSGLQDRPKPS